MSQQLVIDPYRFSREAGNTEGSLSLLELPRLHDLVTEVTGELHFHLRGFLGERGQPRLHLEVSGVLFLACQRCLGAVEEHLDIESLLELIPEDSEPTQAELEDDNLDFLPVAGMLDIKALVEDEILLALPVAPSHEVCGLPSGASTGERPNPFAALAGLKGKLN